MRLSNKLSQDRKDFVLSILTKNPDAMPGEVNKALKAKFGINMDNTRINNYRAEARNLIVKAAVSNKAEELPNEVDIAVKALAEAVRKTHVGGEFHIKLNGASSGYTYELTPKPIKGKKAL